jgi:hypothetical protein
MAIGTPPVLEASGGTSAASHAFGSFTPPANCRLYAWVGGRGASSTIPTISDDLGGTWNAIAGSDSDAGAVAAKLFYQDIGGSPAAMVITAVSTGATQTGGGIISVTGGQNDHTNIQLDTDTAGDPSLTMGSFGANSTGLGFYMNTAGGAVTSPSGYTELLDAAVATNLRCSICYDSVSPGTAMAWTGTGTDTIAVGLEIKETVAGGILAVQQGMVMG